MKRILISLMFSTGLLTSKGQDVEQYVTKYPGEQAIILNAAENYKISLKEGKPYIESTENMQLLFLPSAASSYINRYSFFHSSFHRVSTYSAYTETATRKKLKVTEFKTFNSPSSGVFYDDVKETSFDFPGVSAGAIGNLDVAYTHSNSYLLSPFYFKRGVPVLKARLTISFPEKMIVKYILKGSDTSVIKVSKSSRKGENIFTFQAGNLDGERAYSDAPSKSYYSPHVIFFIEKYINDAGEKINHLGSLDDLYKFNYSFIKDINREPDAAVRLVVQQLTRGVTENIEKAKAIYQWVQKSIKYVAFEDGMGGFIPRDGNLVCKRKYGDCKDMASVLNVMLKAANVPCYFVWIGTRSLPYSYSDVYLPIADNHMIAAVEDEKGGYIFLDGTDSHCIFGRVPYALQNKEALVAIGENKYRVVKIPVSKKEENKLIDTAFITIDSGEIKGKISVKLSGFYATEARGSQQTVSEKNSDKFVRSLMVRGSNKFILDGFNISDSPSSICYSGSFRLDSYAKNIGDDWFVNMNLLKLYDHQEIDYPKRKMPVSIDFLSQKKFVTVLEIPKGYEVGYLPAGKSYKNNIWGFAMKYEVVDGRIIHTLDLEDNYLLLYPDQFSEWNEVLKHLLPLYKESITLSRIK